MYVKFQKSHDRNYFRQLISYCILTRQYIIKLFEFFFIMLLYIDARNETAFRMTLQSETETHCIIEEYSRIFLQQLYGSLGPNELKLLKVGHNISSSDVSVLCYFQGSMEIWTCVIHPNRRHILFLQKQVGSSNTGLYVMFCAIWYHLYNLKNVKNTHEGVLLLACNFTKSNTPPWVFFTFFNLYKWYQIAQYITYKVFAKYLKGIIIGLPKVSQYNSCFRKNL